MADLDLQLLWDLAQLLTDAEVRATVAPEDVNPPGAWVTLEEFSTRTVRGDLRLTVVVYLIVPNTDHRRALEQLQALYNKARTVVTPDGPVRAQGLLLPSAPDEPLPALRVPLYINP